MFKNLPEMHVLHLVLPSADGPQGVPCLHHPGLHFVTQNLKQGQLRLQPIWQI